MTFEECVAARIQVLGDLKALRPAIEAAAQLILNTLRGGGKIITAGNGGSAAEASHFTTELVGRFAKNRRSLPALALSADGSLLTCVGNDYRFEQVFARQVQGLGRAGDLLAVFTSSGNSANIIAALSEAKAQGIGTLAFLGRGGGAAQGLADVELIVPSPSGAEAQEIHLFLIHYFCELIDAEFF